MDHTRSSFTFVDCNGAITERVKFEIKSQAAFHAHAQRHQKSIEGNPQSGTTSVEPLSSSKRRERTSVRVWSPPGPRNRATRGAFVSCLPHAVDEAHQSVLDTRLLQPVNPPLAIANDRWLQDLLDYAFNYALREYWHKFHLEQKLRFSGDGYLSWMRYEAMKDPAMFFLSASTAAFYQLPRGNLNWSRFTWLRMQSIRELNIALSDPARMLSSITILTVFMTAQIEALSNPTVAREVHVPGFRRMLELKGGEDNFATELPGFVMILTRFGCQEMTNLLGVRPLLTPWHEDIVPCITETLPGTVGDEMIRESAASRDGAVGNSGY